MIESNKAPGLMARLRDKWWEGKVYENPPGAALIFIAIVYPFPRRVWNAFAAHWKEHWKFWIGTVIAVGGLLVALARK